MTRVWLGLGANVGNREANLRLALRWLAPECRVVAVSALYESEAVVLEGDDPGPAFLNAACEVRADLDPHSLLARLKAVEHAIGRRPAPRWSPRPIDIDILLFGDQVVRTDDLVVPHPLLAERNFVVVPLAGIAAGVEHPVLRRTIAALAADAPSGGLRLVAGPAWARLPDGAAGRSSTPA